MTAQHTPRPVEFGQLNSRVVVKTKSLQDGIIVIIADTGFINDPLAHAYEYIFSRLP